AALLGVIVELPLQVTVAAGANAETRDDGRKPARVGHESDAGKTGGGGKHGARAVEGRAAEFGIGEKFHLDFPGDKLIGAGGNAGRGRSGLRGPARSGRGLVVASGMFALQVQALQQAVFHLVGIAEDVAEIEADDVKEVFYAVGVTVHEARL